VIPRNRDEADPEEPPKWPDGSAFFCSYIERVFAISQVVKDGKNKGITKK